MYNMLFLTFKNDSCPSFCESTFLFKYDNPTRKSSKEVPWWCSRRNHAGSKFSDSRSPEPSGNNSVNSFSGNFLYCVIKIYADHCQYSTGS